MGHSQFAQFIKARGPNTQINAACASTTQAIGVAEDWIRTGRCKRVLVIAGDNASSPNLLPWIGGGFLAAGGVTTKDKVEEAALPFGKDRHGLIIGAAAAGLLIESKESYEKRGVKPIADVLGTYFANSAFHGSRLDVEHISSEFEKFLQRVEKRYGVNREEIAKKGMFVSHETYTPARGGSAEAEIKSLQNVFKENAYNMTIINTKGFIGHAMGAGIEEAIAIKAMEKGKIPPIANSEKIDPAFAKFKFSKGESVRLNYALRLAAGFGSQLAFVLFRLNSYKDRFSSPAYTKWLSSLGGTKESLFLDGRVLKIESVKPVEEVTTPKKKVAVAPSNILQEVKVIISEKTGYEPEIIEADMHLEEDLGIDSIKAAEILSEISDKWNVPQEQLLGLAEVDTPQKIADFLKGYLNIEEEVSQEPVIVEAGGASGDLAHEIKRIIATHTGYDIEDLSEDYDLEEDLGIDTVKQAEIFGEIRDSFGLSLDETFNLAEFRTIKDIVSTLQPSVSEKIKETAQQPQVTVSTSTTVATPQPSVDKEQTTKAVLEIISRITGYDPEDIEVDMDLEEDLGVDSIKTAEIFSELREEFNLEFAELAEASEIRTTSDIVNYVIMLQSSSTTEEEAEISSEQAPLAIEKEEEVTLRKINPVVANLDEKNVEKFSLSNSSTLLLNLRSNIKKDLVTALDKANAKLTIVDLDSELSEIKAEENYDLIVILLPPNSDFAKDQEYYEKLFLLLQPLNYNHNMKILAISEEEFFGYTADALPLSGGISGLIKTLGQEFELKVKHLYSKDMNEILTEIENWDDKVEVAYREGNRYTLSYTKISEIEEEKIAFTEDDLILVAGGARGITYECIKKLTQEVKPSVAIIGRTELPEDITDLIFLTKEQLEQRKKELKDKLAQEHERVTPVMLEREWQRFLNTIEISKNMMTLIDKEIDVNYYSADIMDAEAVKEAIKQIEEDFDKPITAVIHGAGIEESKAFKKKSIEKSKTIVAVKVEGIKNILQNIKEEQLK
ncbi:MAG: phosphopantetheine-binding protein, partial [Candidatus Heimdallarchaeaceae archaeon]